MSKSAQGPAVPNTSSTGSNTAVAKATAPTQAGGAWQAIKPFLIGGLSGMAATACIQPIDTVKVRIQLKGEELGISKLAGGAVEKGTVSPFFVLREVLEKRGRQGTLQGVDAAF